MTSRNAKRIDPLSKRIPKNPKYSHIKATVDTGASLSKYMARLEDMKKNYRFRPDEIFKRLKATTFVQLVVQVALTRMQEEEEEEERPTPLPGEESPPDTARSTLSSIARGIGELDVAGDESQQPLPSLPPSCPYLLLDIRDTDEYQRCHIISAKSYPNTMLSRSCNYFTQDILDYSNKSGHIIILYDDNERVAPRAATVFVQRGVDNVFILSGGMKVLHRVFPQGIITGALPPSCLPVPSPPPSSRRSQRAPRQPPALPAVPLHPDWPSPGDLTVLQEQLDNVLLANEVPSSRASSRPAGGSRAVSSRSSLLNSRASSHLTSPPSSSRGHTPWK